MTIPEVTLPSGDKIPTVGKGTWNLDNETVQSSVQAALNAGYTHVDTAEGYGNEAAIGEALAEYERDEIFLTSKVLPKHLSYNSLVEACEQSLERLGTDYLDLYLIHWPNPAVSLRESLDAMATLHDRGLIRNVGVSNFSAYQLSCAQHISDVPIAVNQIEFHPWFQRPDLVDYCSKTDTVIEAAAPLARTEILGDSTVQELADKYEKNPAQIALRWAIENEVVVLPKSTSPEHIEQNIELFDFRIDDADRDLLDDLDRDQPVYDTPAKDWTGHTYGIPK
ncbi:aldo/keto reductase (plasmid) [Halorarum halophilum]|uniref:Aldo/keto reductase n=1 Tax=Halorarum halophilum TaxID=2743090 RepID=A0A7D5L331_9EURY|nr:aldo/keto reductase [Halobaculum halophilum]QLG29943.1 aldo/keto reductase [Halobaculum halophilum]